jgi:hypothetical protein
MRTRLRGEGHPASPAHHDRQNAGCGRRPFTTRRWSHRPRSRTSAPPSPRTSTPPPAPFGPAGRAADRSGSGTGFRFEDPATQRPRQGRRPCCRAPSRPRRPARVGARNPSGCWGHRTGRSPRRHLVCRASPAVSLVDPPRCGDAGAEQPGIGGRERALVHHPGEVFHGVPTLDGSPAALTSRSPVRWNPHSSHRRPSAASSISNWRCSRVPVLAQLPCRCRSVTAGRRRERWKVAARPAAEAATAPRAGDEQRLCGSLSRPAKLPGARDEAVVQLLVDGRAPWLGCRSVLMIQ